jgi:hypothetical protein
MARFSDQMGTEVVQRFWAAMARGEFITDAAAEAGTYRKRGSRWLVAVRGVRPRRGRDLKGRCLSFSEREEIALAPAGGESMRGIARRLGRRPSTISRELARNAGCSAQPYRATTAHALAYERARRRESPRPSWHVPRWVIEPPVAEPEPRGPDPQFERSRTRRTSPHSTRKRPGRLQESPLQAVGQTRAHSVAPGRSDRRGGARREAVALKPPTVISVEAQLVGVAAGAPSGYRGDDGRDYVLVGIL